MNLKNYYTQHSDVTDPGKHVLLFEELSDDVPKLCSTIQNLILHYADEEIFNYKIPLLRFKEMDLRFVRNAIELILLYDSRPLSKKRRPETRIIGVCRDNSVLLCSILRSKQIPARLRLGFINYAIPGIYLDTVYVEYWSAAHKKWCVVDTRTSDVFIEKTKIKIDFNLHDLPEDKYIYAAKAWQLSRAGKINPNRFGSRMHRGLWYIRNRLLQDFAFLNKQEVLIWDLWGMMLSSNPIDMFKIPDNQFQVMDALSEFIIDNSFNIHAIHEFYASHQMLHVPTTLLVDNPFAGQSTVSLVN